MIYEKLTHSIIGCAMLVHNKLGTGFQETIYQRCLSIEMDNKDISYKREVTIPIFYDQQKVGSRRVDFVVEDSVLVELKAVKQLENAFLSQTFNYITASGLEIGLLINFGKESLEYKRLYNKNRKYKK